VDSPLSLIDESQPDPGSGLVAHRKVQGVDPRRADAAHPLARRRQCGGEIITVASGMEGRLLNDPRQREPPYDAALVGDRR
jgi:hypothetical protein